MENRASRAVYHGPEGFSCLSGPVAVIYQLKSQPLEWGLEEMC